MEEFKPCPFCGCTEVSDNDYIQEQQCHQCGAKTIVNNWQTRPIEDALTATIAQKDAEIERLRVALNEIIELPRHILLERKHCFTMINIAKQALEEVNDD